jgi:hypothetical protein
LKFVVQVDPAEVFRKKLWPTLRFGSVGLQLVVALVPLPDLV